MEPSGAGGPSRPRSSEPLRGDAARSAAAGALSLQRQCGCAPAARTKSPDCGDPRSRQTGRGRLSYISNGCRLQRHPVRTVAGGPAPLAAANGAWTHHCMAKMHDSLLARRARSIISPRDAVPMIA